jgi:hypothetical protein
VCNVHRYVSNFKIIFYFLDADGHVHTALSPADPWTIPAKQCPIYKDNPSADLALRRVAAGLLDGQDLRRFNCRSINALALVCAYWRGVRRIAANCRCIKGLHGNAMPLCIAPAA